MEKANESPVDLEQSKRCTKCDEDKSLEHYSKHLKCRLGISNICKICQREKTKQWRIENPEKLKKLSKTYSIKHKDKLKAKRAERYAQNPEKLKLRAEKWRIANFEHFMQASKEGKRNRRKFLADSYIRDRLIQNGFPKEQITPELIEVQRLIIKTKRLCKTSQN